jgi:hypothetical protein
LLSYVVAASSRNSPLPVARLARDESIFQNEGTNSRDAGATGG